MNVDGGYLFDGVFFGWLGFAVINERDERQNKQWDHGGGLKNPKRLDFLFPPRWTKQQQMNCLAQTSTEEKR